MNRDELLDELGLTPVWRLREKQILAESLSNAEAEAPKVSEQTNNDNVDSDADRRRQRITALNWEGFADDVAACRACVLCERRLKAVPGVGDKNARWLFVGEGPGAEEDKQGEPFVGQAGKLLNQMLQALGMTRTKEVYIANVVKCRPPGNRAPAPQEAEACRPYLERQITLIQPEIIVALGKSAASLLLNTDVSIASLRGRAHQYHNIPLVVTYHPAYLLRSLTEKAKAWEDLLFARKVMMAGSVSKLQH